MIQLNNDIMKTYTEKNIECPHCDYTINITLDTSIGSQVFYDDCPACSHAIRLSMTVDEKLGEVKLSVDADDEQIF